MPTLPSKAGSRSSRSSARRPRIAVRGSVASRAGRCAPGTCSGSRRDRPARCGPRPGRRPHGGRRGRGADHPDPAEPGLVHPVRGGSRCARRPGPWHRTRTATGSGSPALGLDALTRGIPSLGVPVGSVQVPPNGEPIVTMADGPVTGGYPVIGLVPRLEHGRLAQAAPGSQLRFRRTTVPAARRLAAERLAATGTTTCSSTRAISPPAGHADRRPRPTAMMRAWT